jgi:hypothetical protein
MDNDTGNAIEFYSKALEFDPENIDVKQRLMVALFTDGRFGEGVALARQLKDDPAVAAGFAPGVGGGSHRPSGNTARQPACSTRKTTIRLTGCSTRC